MPSTVARWNLVISANRLSASPWTTCSSHNGRPRSRWRDWIRAASSHSWASLPGGGRALCRTWLPTSKSGSSTQTGWAKPPGTRRSFCRERGTAPIRSLIC